MNPVAQHKRWGVAGEPRPSSHCTRQTGTTSGDCHTVPYRIAPLRQFARRRGESFRMDSSLGSTTSLMHRLESPCRCHVLDLRVWEHTRVTVAFAAAQELSVRTIRFTPKILSAIQKQDCRGVPPRMILGSGDPCFEFGARLRPTRTIPPQLGNQLTFRRTHAALSGATGVDSKTGAAIHRPVAPGESV